MTPEQFQATLKQPAKPLHVVVAGATIAARRWAKPHASCILLVHGHAAHSHWWDHIAPILNRQFDVTAIDLSGAGESDHRDFYAPGLFAEELRAVTAAVGYKDPIIVGHSFGGTLARIACWLYPNWAKQLVLVDSVIAPIGSRPPASNRQDSLSSLNLFPEPRPNRLYQSLAVATKRFRLKPRQPLTHPFIIDHIAAHSVRETARGFEYKLDRQLFKKLMPTLCLPKAGTMIQELALPMAAILGDESAFFNDESSAGRANRQVIQQLFDANCVRTVQRAHHHILLDQPLALTEALFELCGP